MRRLYNLPTYVIIGLLSIYYFAILLNLKSLLKFISGQAPFIIFLSFAFILPIGIKSGILIRNRNKIALRILSIFSLIVVLLFVALSITRTDLASLFKTLIKSGVLTNFHKTIFGLISFITVYLFYFVFIPSINIEELIDNTKALPIASPIFCFGAPVFWKKSLLQFNSQNSDISSLSILSFFTGVIFLIALLLFYIGKNYRVETSVFNNEAALNTQKTFYKISLGLIFLAIATLLFICLDLTYLIVRI